jgi:DNA polymerase-3 subunit gamma/tau
MAYQSLYRRYRPQRFAELRGQEHLVRALQHAVSTETVGHAYLFSGPRGTGKTSTARILAKVLNCANPIDGEPCGVCDSCVAVEQGSSFDVHELDAASNNGVEAIRELINKASMGTPGRTKVYILDEVHMLSTPASNALLKTLEEPPAHVVFVLATTDPQKVLPTIRSRTQHFDVRLLSADELTALAEFIIDDAGLEVPPGAVDYVVRVGAGSARDMESALDQVVAAGGIPDDSDALDELVEALCERDTGRAMLAVEAAIAGGRAPRMLGEMLIGRLRDVFLASMKSDLARLPDRDRQRVTEQAGRLGPAGATRALEVLGEAFVGIQDAPDQRIPLEVALVRLTRPELDTSVAALADRVTLLEQGAPRPAGTSPASSAGAAATPADSSTSAEAARADVRAGSGPEASTAPTSDDPASDAEAESAGGAGPAEPPAAAGGEDAPSDEGDQAVSAGAGDGRPASSAREMLQAKKQARGGPSDRPTAPRRPTSADAGPTGTGQPTYTPPTSPEPAPTEPTATEPAPTGAKPGRPLDGVDYEAQPLIEASVPEAPVTVAADRTASELAGTADAAPTGGAGTGLPSRDELIAAWDGSILASLPPRAKAFFSGGRFLEVTDRAAVFGLPNAIHMQKCENGRTDVEAALSAHFGRRVALQLAVDDDSPLPSAPAPGAPPAPAPVDEHDEIDLAELVDATDVGSSSVDRVRELFPGAELVDPA